MDIEPSHRQKRSPAFWVMAGLLILLNLWFDYYHPLGFIMDVVIVAWLVTKWAGA